MADATTPDYGGYVPIDPNKPLQPEAPAKPDTGGYVPYDPAAAPKEAPAKPDTGGYKTIDPNAGQPPPPSGGSFGDWAAVAGNEAMAYGVPGLRTWAEEARKKLSPEASASADLVGATVSPTQLLNFFGGPELAGATHEGIKSYMTQPNWVPDQAGMARIGEDTAVGAATGSIGRYAAHLLPEHGADLVREYVRWPAAAATAWAGHQFGHELVGMGLAPAAFALATKYGNKLGDAVKGLGENPGVQQAIKSLVLGTGSAARQQTGPLDQYVWPSP